MGRSLENKKKLAPVQTMNSGGLNSENIVNNVSVFNDIATINSIFKE
jgi:hypothetical protein